MATSVRLIRRYVWLIDTIRRAGRLTLEEINQKWMDERTLRLENKGDDEVMGVNVDYDYDCEKVMLRVYGRQRAYIETLPLHKSQRLVKAGKESSDYELTIRPEYEFQHAILALGPEAEILSPGWLRDELRILATDVLRRYS